MSTPITKAELDQMFPPDPPHQHPAISPCKYCGTMPPHPVEIGPFGPHHGKVVCAGCERFVCWMRKP